MKQPGQYQIAVQGLAVIELGVSDSFKIHFWVSREGGLTITIAGGFECTVRGQHYTVPEERDPVALGPTLALLGHKAEALTAGEDGTLRLALSEGAQVTVAPADGYESWHLNGPSGLLVVCLPGGGLAVWDAKPDTGP
jgi:hypothetical protein